MRTRKRKSRPRIRFIVTPLGYIKGIRMGENAFWLEERIKL